MNKSLFVSALALLTGCVATPQLPYEIKQDISEDKTLSDKIFEYQNKKEYQELTETKQFLDSIDNKWETKSALTTSEYDKLQRINSQRVVRMVEDARPMSSNPELMYKSTPMQVVCLHCGEKECIINDSSVSKDDIVDKVATLVNSFNDDFSSYCEKYNNGSNTHIGNFHDDRRLYTKEDAVKNCKQELNTYFCKQMFKDTDFNINFSHINDKMSEYWDKQWEKNTGCKKTKSTKYMGIYQVLQQTSNGTLAIVNPREASHLYFYQMPEIVFITKNKIDSKLTDGENIPSGDLFEEIGTYQYTSTMGSMKTVKKYRRCLNKK